MNHKIMVVDDSIFARKLLIDILNKNGFEKIVEAKNGNEAIEIHTIEKPDLILLDLIMPKMDGLKTIQKLMNLNEKVKIIVTSAIGQEKIITRALKNGASEFIVKPVDEKILMKAIKEVIA